MLDIDKKEEQMSPSPKEGSDHSTQKMLDDWSRRLEREARFPDRAQQLFDQLTAPEGAAARATEADYDLLAVLVGNALENIDIQQTHPRLYQLLVEDSDFRDAFLEVMELALEEG